MDAFNIRAPKGQKSKKMLGRGVGSGHGKTAGKGTKGQKSRAGGGVRLGFEGGQMPLFRRVARRGFSNYPFKKRYCLVAVEALNAFADGDTVDRQSLQAHGLVRGGKRAVKILGDGELTRRLTVRVDKVSAGAAKKIEAAGGSVVALPGQAGGPAAAEKESK